KINRISGRLFASNSTLMEELCLCTRISWLTSVITCLISQDDQTVCLLLLSLLILCLWVTESTTFLIPSALTSLLRNSIKLQSGLAPLTLRLWWVTWIKGSALLYSLLALHLVSLLTSE